MAYDYPHHPLIKGQVLKTSVGRKLGVVRWVEEPPYEGYCLYEVTDGTDRLLLQWYLELDVYSEQAIKHAKRLILLDPPSKSVVWPIDAVKYDGEWQGILTRWIPEQYQLVTEGELRQAPSFRILADECINLCSVSREIHMNGWCFNGVDPLSLYVDEASGKVLFSDFWRFSPEGSQITLSHYEYSLKYLAPEQVREESACNAQSDRHTLAVMLFELLFRVNPLDYWRYESRGMNLGSRDTLEQYGTDPVFIIEKSGLREEDYRHFWPDLRAMFERWDELPGYLRELFQRAFSYEALHSKEGRPTEEEWIHALARFRSDIYSCSCGNEVFTEGGAPATCSACGKRTWSKLAFELPGYRVALTPNTRLYGCQLGTRWTQDPAKVVAKVVRSKTNKRVGVGNVSEEAWLVTAPNGKTYRIERGQAVPAMPGVSLAIGGVKICIERNEEQRAIDDKNIYSNIDIHTTLSAEPAADNDEGSVAEERYVSAAPKPAILPVFFVLDTSGSMRNVSAHEDQMDSLRRAMRHTVETLAVWDRSTEVQLMMATLVYNSNATWAIPYGLNSVRDQDSINGFAELRAHGLTGVGKALSELNDKLSTSAFLEKNREFLPAVIVFMTDGFACDDYERELSKISQNPYYQNAIKVGCALGENPDSEMVVKIVGDADAMIRVRGAEAFRHLFSALSLAAVHLALVANAGGKVATGSGAVDSILDFVPDEHRAALRESMG